MYIIRAEFAYLKQKIDKIVYKQMGDTKINLSSPEQLAWLIYSMKPKDKKVAYSLRYVHGIGLNTAMRVCELAKVDPEVRVTDLSSKDEDAIRKVIVDLKLLIEGELRSENLKNVKRLQDIGSYRGVRHRKSLPVRGQRTKTNSRTKRSGKKQTISLGKKAV